MCVQYHSLQRICDQPKLAIACSIAITNINIQKWIVVFAYTSIARQGSLLWSPNRALDVSPRTATLVSGALGGGAAIGGRWGEESTTTRLELLIGG